MPRPSSLVRGLVALAVGCSATLAQAGPYSGLYVFGDSLSDIGNDLIATTGTVDVLPAPSIYTDGTHTGRFTNGLNYADGLAVGLGLPLTPSLAGGTDYAYGGARTTTNIIGAAAQSFNQQIAAYDSNHAAADPGALYVLWIGSNDMADAVRAAAAPNANVNAILGSAITTALTGIGTAIADLSGRGARHFLIGNVPDLSLTPAVRSVGVPAFSGLAQGASVAFNQNLAATLASPSFSALDIRSFNAFAAQTAITLNPGAYGFSNVTSSCYTGEVDGSQLAGGPVPSVCPSAAGYMYWDYEHPSAALHAQLAQLALTAAVPEPAAWATLLAGLALLPLGRRAQRRAARQAS